MKLRMFVRAEHEMPGVFFNDAAAVFLSFTFLQTPPRFSFFFFSVIFAVVRFARRAADFHMIA